MNPLNSRSDLQGEQMAALLSKFVDPGQMTPATIENCYDHLFNGTAMPYLMGDDLYETVLYLKDIMTSNDLRTLSEILDYFRRKKELLRAYIDTILLPKRSSSCCIIFPDEFVSHYPSVSVLRKTGEDEPSHKDPVDEDDPHPTDLVHSYNDGPVS